MALAGIEVKESLSHEPDFILRLRQLIAGEAMTPQIAKAILVLPILMALAGDTILKTSGRFALVYGTLLFGLEAPLVWLVYKRLTFLELAIYWQVLTAFVTLLLSVLYFNEGFSLRHSLALALAIFSALLLEQAEGKIDDLKAK